MSNLNISELDHGLRWLLTTQIPTLIPGFEQFGITSNCSAVMNKAIESFPLKLSTLLLVIQYRLNQEWETKMNYQIKQ